MCFIRSPAARCTAPVSGVALSGAGARPRVLDKVWHRVHGTYHPTGTYQEGDGTRRDGPGPGREARPSGGDVARLLEHQGKSLLREAGLAVPAGRPATTPGEAADAAAHIGGPVVVKAQLQAGGRGKAGAVLFAATAAAAARSGGRAPRRRDQGRRRVHRAGRGAARHRARVLRRRHPRRGPRRPPAGAHGEPAGRRGHRIGPRRGHPSAARLASARARDRRRGRMRSPAPASPATSSGGSTRCASRSRGPTAILDCFALEVNPIVLTKQGELVCADCKMQIDNAAVYRHPEMGIGVARDFGHEPTPLDLIGWGIEKADLRGLGLRHGHGPRRRRPRRHRLSSHRRRFGDDGHGRAEPHRLKPANYADTSGNPVGSKVYRVAKVVLSQPSIQGYLLGGFMMANQEQWHHAHAVVKALREVLPGKPGFPCVLSCAATRKRSRWRSCARGSPTAAARPASRSTAGTTSPTPVHRRTDAGPGRGVPGRAEGRRPMLSSPRGRSRSPSTRPPAGPARPRPASPPARRTAAASCGSRTARLGGAPRRREVSGRAPSAWPASTPAGCAARAPIEVPIPGLDEYSPTHVPSSQPGGGTMGILIDASTRVVVQGITGREGSLRARYMKEYGTDVVAGTSPGKGGQTVAGIPVYDTVRRGRGGHAAGSTSVSSSSPAACCCRPSRRRPTPGCPTSSCCVESVPVHDAMAMVEYCAERGTTDPRPGLHRRHHTGRGGGRVAGRQPANGPTASSPRGRSACSRAAAASRARSPGCCAAPAWA